MSTQPAIDIERAGILLEQARACLAMLRSASRDSDGPTPLEQGAFCYMVTDILERLECVVMGRPEGISA